MLGDVLGAVLEFLGDIIFGLLPNRIAWHFLGALGFGLAAAIAVSPWPDRMNPAAAAVLGTLAMYPAVVTVYWIARRNARRSDAIADKKSPDPTTPRR